MNAKPSRRMTQQRKLILEELKKLTCHPTAEELYQLVREKLPSISIATVYRNLEILSDDGIVLKLNVAGTQRRFDATTANHYHIRCLGCGRVDDVHMDLLPTLEGTAQRFTGYTVVSHRVEFSGFCPACTSGD